MFRERKVGPIINKSKQKSIISAHLQKVENLLGTYNILLKNYVYAENRSFVVNVAIIRVV